MDMVKILLWKHVKDAMKNKAILLVFFTLLMLYTLLSFQMTDVEKAFSVPGFIILHLILNPILVTVTIISEEKEKFTLHALMISGVKLIEYMLGHGIFV